MQLGKIERGEIERPHQQTVQLIAASLGLTVEILERHASKVDRLENLITREIRESVHRTHRRAEGESSHTAFAEDAQRIFGDF